MIMDDEDDDDEAGLLWQAAEAPIGGEKVAHEARNLQACGDGNPSTPNLQHRVICVTTATVQTENLGKTRRYCKVSTVLAQHWQWRRAPAAGWTSFWKREEDEADQRRWKLNHLKTETFFTRKLPKASHDQTHLKQTYPDTIAAVTVDSDSLRQRPIQSLRSVVVFHRQRGLQPLAGVETPWASVLP